MEQQAGDPAQGSADGEESLDAAAAARMQESDVDRRAKLVGGHLLIGVSLFCLWAAADAWQAVTQLRAAALLSVLAAIPAGFVFGTLVHEWCHFAGARLSGARYRIPERFGLFVFDFDFRNNGLSQFFAMSYGGQVGSVLAVLILAVALPLDTAGRAMVIAACIGGGVFGAMIEWPVLARTRRSGDPLAELGKIDKNTLYRSAGGASAATLLSWLLLA